jgi:hypothetical protein
MKKKITKLWYKFSFWDKIRLTLGAIGIGGEVTLFIVESFPQWRILAAIATIISIVITYFFKDENKNGVVDTFEKT